MIPDFKTNFDNGGRTSKQTNKSYCLVNNAWKFDENTCQGGQENRTDERTLSFKK